MNSRQEKYKRKRAGFNDLNDGRVIRAGRQEERRRLDRAENFAKNRDLLRETKEVRANRRSDIGSRLRRWKEERALKKKLDDSKKKPVFKVGVVHHNFYSPVQDKYRTKTQPCHSRDDIKPKPQPAPPKRVSKVTQQRLEARKRATASTTTNVASKASPRSARLQRKRLCSAKKVPTESFAPANYNFTAPSGVKELPIFGTVAIPSMSAEQSSTANAVTFDLKLDADSRKEKPSASLSDPNPSTDSCLQTTRSQLEAEMDAESLNESSSAVLSNRNSSTDFCLHLSSEDEATEEPTVENNGPLTEAFDAATATPPRSGTPVPVSFSPYVVTSRGKDSARKERMSRMGIRSSSSNEIPTKDTVMQNLNVSVEEEEQTAQYFKFLLDRETDRLNDLCAKWDAERTDSNVSEDVESLIVAAIGHTKLLMRKKFARFRSLINDCETGKGELLVRCKDLGGFWDLMDREVKDCDSRFSKLESLKANDWVEEEEAVLKKVTTKRKAVRAKSKPKINAKSSARSWILAARKRKMAQEAGLENDVVTVPESVEPAPSTSAIVASPRDLKRKRHASTPKTPTSVLSRVLLSEASKDVTSPLAIMKVSKMLKSPQVTMDQTISYVNSDQTPGKGILKKSEESSGSGSRIPKSSRKVDFNDDVVTEELPAAEVDEALQNSIDLGRALARIDSYVSESDSDESRDPTSNVTLRTVQKLLDFDDKSFNENEDINVTGSVVISAAAPEMTAIPDINVTEQSPIKTTTKKMRTKNHRRSSRLASSVVEVPAEEAEVEEPVDTRALRNRLVVVETPKSGNRRTTRPSVAGESNSRSSKTSAKENADPQRGARQAAGPEFSGVLGTEQENEDHTKRRRSTRKSVRFNPDDCTACGEAPKRMPPMTPDTRRSRKNESPGQSVKKPSRSNR